MNDGPALERWVAVLRADDLQEGEPVAVSLEGRAVALYRAGGTPDAVYATDDTCSHMQASLAEGEQQGFIVTCPRHGGQFDIRSGQAVRFPAVAPIATFPVQIQGGKILIRADVL